MIDNRRGILAMSGSVVVFIFNDALIKLATETMPPLQAIGLRGCFATLWCLLALLVRRHHPLAEVATASAVSRYPLIGGSGRGGEGPAGWYRPQLTCDNFEILCDVALSSDAVWIASPAVTALRAQGHAVVMAGPDQLRVGQSAPASLSGARAGALAEAAARADLVERVVRPALAAGAVVVADRFLASPLVAR